MKSKSTKLVLLGIGAVFALAGVYLSTSGFYGHTRSTSESSTYNQIPIEKCDRNAKRLIKSRWSYLSFKLDTVIGFGETTRDLSKLKQWQDMQGECPYQVMDVTQLKVASEFFVVALIFAILGIKHKKDGSTEGKVVDDKEK